MSNSSPYEEAQLLSRLTVLERVVGHDGARKHAQDRQGAAGHSRLWRGR